MARGKIKIVSPNDTGSIVDNDSGKEINFIQPGINDLELKEKSVVQYELLTLESGASVAVSFKAIRKGTIKSITAGENNIYSGDLSDNVTGAVYQFKSVYTKASAPAAGAKVGYELIKSSDCKNLAINLTTKE